MHLTAKHNNLDWSTNQIDLFGQCPPIEKMDAALSTLKACKCALLVFGGA
jgi:hypothetical protein